MLANSGLPLFSNVFSQLGMDNLTAFDLDYLYNNSGLKAPSLLIEHIYTGIVMDDSSDIVVLKNGMKVTWDYVWQNIDEEIISNILSSKYQYKWNGLLETIKQNYDIFKPFAMTVTDDTEDTLESKNERNDDYSGTSKNDMSGTSSDTVGDKTFGFNSTNGVDADSSKTDSEYSDTGSGEESGESNSVTDYNRTNTVKKIIVRSGNIGNMSNQELLRQQREIVQFEMLPVIYKDLDSVLTRSKYY